MPLLLLAKKKRGEKLVVKTLYLIAWRDLIVQIHSYRTGGDEIRGGAKTNGGCHSW